MRVQSIMMFSLLWQTSTSQTCSIINRDTVNRTDKRGWKQGKWILQNEGNDGRDEFYYVNNKKNGPYRSSWKNNVPSEIGYYKNDKQEGKLETYIDGKLFRASFYRNGKIVSQTIDYFGNGRPKNGGTFFRGNGELIEYDSAGSITSKITYKENRRDGPFSRYYPNNQLKEKGIYRDNKYWTIQARYFPSGDEDDCSTIKNGNGTVCVRNDSGLVTKIETYKEGLLWNIMRYRALPVEYENIGHFKNGNGIIKEYDDIGKIKTELTYKNGRLNGNCKYYYGSILLAGECINDLREGRWLRYDRGMIRNIITYKKDREWGIACF